MAMAAAKNSTEMEVLNRRDAARRRRKAKIRVGRPGPGGGMSVI